MTTTEQMPSIENPLKRRGPLDAAELADSAVTAALVVALLAAGRALASGSVFQVIASFVVAVLAARRRGRTVIIATFASATIALLLGGLGPVSYALLAGVFGWCGGVAVRNGWGRMRAIGFTLLFGWPAMAGSIMFFYPAIAINKRLRSLLFDNAENQANGIGNFVGWLGQGADWLIGIVVGLFGGDFGGLFEGPTESFGNGVRNVASFLIDNWLLLIPATELVYAVIYALIIRSVAGAIVRRLEATLVAPQALSLVDSGAPQPVPVSISGTQLARNGVTVTSAIDLQVEPREHIVVEGPNGAGKSTLLDALAGLDNHNAVVRAGDVGLGSPGGTARVGQRPEAQVVGTTVEEDLRWGLADADTEFDTTGALTQVGLAHIPSDRPTSELSGGELQRLALAAALQREPQLLLVDEVTSMLDPEEQRRITTLLGSLENTAIVRTTHRDDAEPTDRLVELHALRSDADPLNAEPASRELRTIQSSVTEAKLLRLRDVGYSHNATHPWRLDVLKGLDLSIHRYEMIVVEGRNGSGKTTLARIIAGLVEPTEGVIERAEGVRRALAYQHVRLQLLRPTVIEEMRSLAGVPAPHHKATDPEPDTRAFVRQQNLESSLHIFDLADMQDRRIDELSGGEQRRVLLAGLVSRGVSILVLDEPLAGLDAAGRSELAITLDKVRLAGTSIVVVSHDTNWSPPHVDQRLVLDGGRLQRTTS